MRWDAAGNLLGTILLFLSLLMLLPFAVALFMGTGDAGAFLKTIVITLLSGEILLICTENRKISFRYHESFSIVTLIWVVVCFYGSLPYIFYGTFDSVLDAFFEAVSGFTTTGATVLLEVGLQPEGILLWRSLTHWTGGLGVIFIFTALWPAVRFRGGRLLSTESTGPLHNRLKPRLRDTALLMTCMYVVFTLTGLFLLLINGLELFEAVIYSFSAVSTGGFATRALSVMGLQNARAEMILIVVMLLSSGSFNSYYQFLSGRFEGLLRNRELRFYLRFVCCASVSVVVLLRLFVYDSIYTSLRYGVFQVVSVLSTTGFITADYDLWPAGLRFIIFILLFCGGCSGSTAGGIKSIRIMYLWRRIRISLARQFNPKTVFLPGKNGGYAVSVQEKAVDFFLLYIFIFIAATVSIAVMGMDIITASSAVASTLGNVGPGMGVVGPLNTFLSVPDAGKIVLIFCMLLGRLEMYSVLAAFSLRVRN